MPGGPMVPFVVADVGTLDEDSVRELLSGFQSDEGISDAKGVLDDDTRAKLKGPYGC